MLKIWFKTKLVYSSFGNSDKKAVSVSEAILKLSELFMAFNFHTYLKAKDNFCFSYNGAYKEFIWQLLHVRKFAEQQFPGINIFISCSEKIAKSINEERVISSDEFKNNLFLKTEEIIFDMINNPILEIVKKSQIKISKTSEQTNGNKCCIIGDTKAPFKSISEKQLISLKKSLNNLVNIDEADVLYAVECEELYKWAYFGKKTVLLKHENNDEVYKNLFPGREILNMNNI